MRKHLIAAGCMFLIGCSGGNGGVTKDAGPKDSAPDVIFDAAEDVFQITPSGLDGGYGSFDLGSPETDPMIYLGGNVMTAPINVYVIWYGSWQNSITVPIVEDLLSHIGGSTWFNINTTYYQKEGGAENVSDAAVLPLRRKAIARVRNVQQDAGTTDASDIMDGGINDGGEDSDAWQPRYYVDGSVNLIKSVTINYSFGKKLYDTDIAKIVSNAITDGLLPLDQNGAYFVFTSKDVSEASDFGYFCSDYCGWHDSQKISDQDIKYVFVGDTSACLDACSLQSEYESAGFDASPNGDWAADSMASVVAHELSELASDPDPITYPSWQDDQGAESADKCAWTFGKPYLTKSGSVANVSIGSRDYMIQQNWVLDSDAGHCDLHL